jgi:predicted Zn finger-like uncharacterized protein
MIITCKECKTKFNLDDSIVKETGTKVRCSVCKDVFTAYPSPEVEQLRREEMLAEAEQALAGDAEDLIEGFDEEAGEFTDGKASGSKESRVSAESDELDDISRMFHMTGDLGDDPEELDPDSNLETSAPEFKKGAEEELDLSDLEDGLELDSETKPEGSSAGEPDLDLDFDLKEGLEGEGDLEEKLDLSDEDGLELETETEPEEKPEEKKDAAEELDLDLDFDDTLEDQEASDEELDLSELEEHLEMDSAESGRKEPPTVPVEDEELEAIDFEESLELDTEITADEASEKDFDTMDLRLESKSDDPAAAEEENGENFRLGAEPQTDETEELHLELESEEGSSADEKQPDISETEDFRLDSDGSEDKEGPEPENSAPGVDLKAEARSDESGDQKSPEEENFDLSDIEKMIEEEEETGGAPAAASVGARTRVDSGSARESSEAAELIAEPGIDQQEGGFEIPEEKDEAESGDPGRRRRIGTPVWILLILVFFGAAGYGGFYAADRMGVRIPFIDEIGKKIPFIGSLIKPVVEDAGNLKISTIDIAGKFISNSRSGRLFVISGSAKNGYQEPRAMIKIAGSLYSQGKKLVKTEEIFSGNYLSDAELADMDLESIRSRLKNRAGDNRSNLNVPPGREVPFMLVFSDLPENLEEYTIEVKESFPAAKK